MKYGVYYAYWCKDWGGDYAGFMRRAADDGLDILEIGAGDLPGIPDAELRELGRRAKDLGLDITCNMAPPKTYDVSAADPAQRKLGVDYMCSVMDKMAILGSRAIAGILYTWWPNCETDEDKPGVYARAVESAKLMGAHAADLGITMCHEIVNRFETMLLNTAQEGVRFAHDVDMPNVKLLLDVFHMNIEEDSIPAAIRLSKGLLGHFHVSEGSRRLPGRGSMDWKAVGGALRDIGYDGSVVLEPFVHNGGTVGRSAKIWRDLTEGASEEEMDRALRESVAFLKRAF